MKTTLVRNNKVIGLLVALSCTAMVIGGILAPIFHSMALRSIAVAGVLLGFGVAAPLMASSVREAQSNRLGRNIAIAANIALAIVFALLLFSL